MKLMKITYTTGAFPFVSSHSMTTSPVTIFSKNITTTKEVLLAVFIRSLNIWSGSLSSIIANLRCTFPSGPRPASVFSSLSDSLGSHEFKIRLSIIWWQNMPATNTQQSRWDGEKKVTRRFVYLVINWIFSPTTRGRNELPIIPINSHKLPIYLPEIITSFAYLCRPLEVVFCFASYSYLIPFITIYSQ